MGPTPSADAAKHARTAPVRVDQEAEKTRAVLLEVREQLKAMLTLLERGGRNVN